MIDPLLITTERVGQLPPALFGLTDKIPHEIGDDLKQGTVQQLADTIGDYLGGIGGLAFNPNTVADGGTLPSTTDNEFMLLGSGTFHNVGGNPDIITTEELNVVTSNGSFWSLAVEIPINVELAGITQNIRAGYTATTPSENAVFLALDDKLNLDGYVGTAQSIIDYIDLQKIRTPAQIEIYAGVSIFTVPDGKKVDRVLLVRTPLWEVDEWTQSGTTLTITKTMNTGNRIQINFF